MMKKTLIASAVASAFSLNAFAADVSINGYLSSGVEFGDSSTAGAVTDGKTMGNAANNVIVFGISEDLDNGSQAYGTLVYTVNGTAQGNLSTRATRIGLRGDFGDVAFGMGEMIYEVGQIVDAHLTDYAGNELNQSAIAGGGFDFTRIDSNVLVYQMSPLGAFTPTIVYGYNNTTELVLDANGEAANGNVLGIDEGDSINGGVANATYDDSLMQVAIDYNNGAGLNAQFAYAAYTDVDPTSGVNHGAMTNAGVADATGTRLTVRYDTGGMNIAATYQTMEVDHAAEADYDNDGYDGKTWKRDTMFLHVTVPVATGRISAGYGIADDVSVDGVSLNESGTKVYNVSYQYDLSPNTYLFARMGKFDSKANYDLGNTDQNDTTSQVVGIKIGF